MTSINIYFKGEVLVKYKSDTPPPIGALFMVDEVAYIVSEHNYRYDSRMKKLTIDISLK